MDISNKGVTFGETKNREIMKVEISTEAVLYVLRFALTFILITALIGVVLAPLFMMVFTDNAWWFICYPIMLAFAITLRIMID